MIIPAEQTKTTVRTDHKGRRPFVDLYSAIERVPEYARLREALNDGATRSVNVTGAIGSLPACLAALIYRDNPRPTLIVVAEGESATHWHDDLSILLGHDVVTRFCAWETLPYEFRTPGPETTGRRLQTLWRCLEQPPPVVIADWRAACEPTIPREKLADSLIRFGVGEETDHQELLGQLIALGYRRTSVVEEAGTFASRGGIVDLFTYSQSEPIRVEFFGDTVESIRRFSVSTQRTTGQIERCVILPSREVETQGEHWTEGWEQADLEDQWRERLEMDPDRPGLEWLAGRLGQTRGRLIDYFADNALVWSDDPNRLQAKHDDLIDEAARFYERLSPTLPGAPEPVEVYGSHPEWQDAMSLRTCVALCDFRSGTENAVAFDAVGPPSVNSSVELLHQELDRLAAIPATVTIGCDNRGQADRLIELLEERHTHARCEYPALHSGFVMLGRGYAYLTEHEILNRRRTRSRKRRFQEGLALSSYTQLKKGDFVVHIDHGIGHYRGLESIELDGERRDCLLIHYQAEDRLYVPIEEFDRVQKYSGKEGRPALSRLGGTAWEKVKSRAKQALMAMAEELVALYAARKARPGTAFPSGGDWMRQMEDAFVYDETPDQAAAIREVSKDMGDATPMDRLICGDVGYGKTEVAIRAAFRAVCHHKQVGILVPTTILAQQHLATFRDRLSEFPVRIETLSRFRSRQEQKRIVSELAAGKVDIVIGTHRLLQKDVEFSDLGLLIIDEEHRFGVRHKERLRQMKQTVDTLALSATPIPRTLQMSLLGSRDLSLINTSPRDRLPVQTEIRPFGSDVISEAILREIDRGGQIYFVHNRVQTIAAMADYLRPLVPSVRIGVAHGQMKERELETVMEKFYHSEYDLLLSTSIIESGLDLPTVNTIIIHRADHFGLAQLYQLRGRVGRAARQAYAYLMVPPSTQLSSTAKARLQAIEEHTALGSGFHLAMRDLEIRGAGNLLGPQQHGFIEEVGFDLFCRLLDEAVSEVRGTVPQSAGHQPVQLEAPGERFLPDDYVPDNQQRFEMYKRLAELTEPDAVDDLMLEMTDRFGAPPDPARRLLELAQARVWARKAGVARGVAGRHRWIIVFAPERSVKRQEIGQWQKEFDDRVEYSTGPPFEMTIRPAIGESADLKGLIGHLRMIAGEPRHTENI